MGIVLREPPHPGESRKRAALLVSVDGTELGQPERQLAVASSPGPEDQVVHRAVHGLEVVVLAHPHDVAVGIRLFVDVHGREHALCVPLKVLADLVQVRLGDVRRVHQLVAVAKQLTPEIVLDLEPDDAALRVEHRKARPDLVGEREEIELSAEFAMIATCGRGSLLDIGDSRPY